MRLDAATRHLQPAILAMADEERQMQHLDRLLIGLDDFSRTSVSGPPGSTTWFKSC